MQDIATVNSEDGFENPSFSNQCVNSCEPCLKKKRSGQQLPEGTEFEAVKRLGSGAQASVYLAKTSNVTEDINDSEAQAAIGSSAL